MTKFKTVVSRWAYSTELDKGLEKAFTQIHEEGGVVTDVIPTIGDLHIAAIVKYEHKPKPTKKTKAKSEE